MQLEKFLEITAILTSMYWNGVISDKTTPQQLKALLAEKVGEGVLENRKIVVHENDESTLHVSIPKKPMGNSDQVLAEEELDKVAGGGSIRLGGGEYIGDINW